MDNQQKKRSPTIGIVMRYSAAEKRYWIDQAYMNLMSTMGSFPLLLKCDDENLVERYLSFVDGILLTGGESIHPKRYRGIFDPNYNLYQPERDAFEHKLVLRARELSKPVFGICRGAQVIASAMGANLIGNLATVKGTVAHRIDRYTPSQHKVEFTQNSSFYSPLGENTRTVYSLHTQGISQNALPPTLKISAIAEDGAIEAIEANSGTYVGGIMWHPEKEDPISPPRNQQIFNRFLEECLR